MVFSIIAFREGTGDGFLLHDEWRGVKVSVKLHYKEGEGGRSKFRQKVGYVTVECSHAPKLFLIWCLTANIFSNSQFIQHNPQCIYRFEY